MTRKEINDIVRPYAWSSNRKAVWQMINTIIPYFGLIGLSYWMLQQGISYWLVLPILVLPALFLVRIFIMFHDCTHSSFMTSKRAMSFLGHIFGILTFTPYYMWKREHLTHHRTVGNLEQRGVGDVWTMTVEEYEQSSKLKKLGYRLYRHPFFLFVVGPVYMFTIHNRLPIGVKTKQDWISLIITNLGVIGIIVGVWLTVGIRYYLLIQMPIIAVAASAGIWLFYVQHQFEDVYWEDKEHWDITKAALAGSSVYRLPVILDWFSGNIAYHNVHHLNARVPNYHLRKLYHRTTEFQESREIRIRDSLKLAMLYLYDEGQKQLITRRNYLRMKRMQQAV